MTTKLINTSAAPALNKANARDVAKARKFLAADAEHGPRVYAASLSAIHRSSNFRQQQAVETAIHADGMAHLFRRHPVNGCMLSALAA